MSLLSRFLGQSTLSGSAQDIATHKCSCKLEDIVLNYCGLEGDEQMRKMAENGDYEQLKFKSLELYNNAYDKYLETGTEKDLNLMYIYYKNSMACYLMWYYHDQIIALFGDKPEDFIVTLFSTVPFEFPESLSYHGKQTDKGIVVPFLDFYRELETCMPIDIRFVYITIAGPQ